MWTCAFTTEGGEGNILTDGGGFTLLDWVSERFFASDHSCHYECLKKYYSLGN